MTATLPDLLRDRPDEELVALLRLRPDLVAPLPADMAALAARVQSRVSVTRAVDQLDRFQLEMLDALRLTRDSAGHSSIDQVLAITAAPSGRIDVATVRAAIHRLRDYLLVYGQDEALQVVATLDEVLGPYPAALGRPAAELTPQAAELAADPARLRRTLLSAPPAARAVLNRLAGDGPVGTSAARDQAHDQADAESPVDWLVERGLLAPTGPGQVELPREVGLLLRRDTGPLGTLHPEPPAPAAVAVDAAAVDAAGAGQVLEMVRHAEAVLESFAAEPVPLLRAGGIGVRDLRRLARAAGVTEAVAALLVETAAAAGLLDEIEPEAEPGRTGQAAELRPTTDYDAWRTAPMALRWHALIKAWLAMTRAPGLVGRRDSRGRIIGALTTEAEQSSAPAMRRAALEMLAGLPSGTAPTAEEVVSLLAWHRPRRTAGRQDAIEQLLAEAAQWGITGRAALTSYGAALVAEQTDPRESDDPLGTTDGTTDGTTGGETTGGEVTKATAVLDGLLPAPVDELLVQADLTLVVPGPPEPALAAELELVSDPESSGGASVHRITRDSLRRAFDAGYTAEDVHGLFARRSRTEVPQALSYLVDDVARAHGGLRAGSAGGYLRSDDEALLAQIAADRQLATLGLRRLAPTVLISTVTSGRLLRALREAGYSPVPEDGQGAAVLVRPRRKRAPARTRMAASGDPPAATRPSTPRLLGIIEDVRRGDAATQAARRAPAGVASGPAAGADPAQAHTEALAVLQQAVRERAMVWIGYVDARGTTTRRLLRAVSIGAGYLRAEDERSDTMHTFALHRVTGAVLDA